MSNQTLLLIMGISGALFVVIIIAYLILRKVSNTSDAKRIRQLREGTKEKKYTSDVLYQKIYIYLIQIPYLKRYINKIRRRLEIINIDDEYLTRKQTAQIITKALLIIIPLTVIIIWLTHTNWILLSTLLLFEVFLIVLLYHGQWRL